MSRSIFIQNTAGIEAGSANNDPEDVASGKVVLMDVRQNGRNQIGLGTAELAPNRFQIIQGTPDSGENARRSGIINRDDIIDVVFEAYSAPVKQVTTVTPNTGNEGRVGLKITRIDQGFEKYPRANYEIEQEAGDTATELVTKFKAAIADAKSKASTINSPQIHIVDESGTDTLILTAIDPGYHDTGTPRRDWISFATSIEGEGSDGWTIASTTAPDVGTGSYEQVAAYERKAQGNLGYYHTETPYSQQPKTYADENTTYDLVTLLVKTNAEKSINKSFEHHEHVIAVKSGELTEATILTIFGFDEGSPA